MRVIELLNELKKYPHHWQVHICSNDGSKALQEVRSLQIDKYVEPHVILES